MDKKYFSGRPGGLSNAKTFSLNQNNSSKQQVDAFFNSNPTTATFFPRQYEKKRFQHKATMTHLLDYVHVDTAELGSSRGSSVYKYFIVVAEGYTRALFAKCVKDKTEVTAALIYLLEHKIFPYRVNPTVPVKIFSDQVSSLKTCWS